MNSIAKVGKTLALLVVLAMVAIGAGLVIAWYMGNHEAVPPVALPDVRIPQPLSRPGFPWRYQPTLLANVSRPASLARGWANPAEPPDTRPWEQRLDGILLGGGEANDKADAIRKLMTVAPPEAQVELSQHLINMVQDDHYDGAAELLTNATTQTAVATVLMNDLLNRRNTLKLPMLLAIARNIRIIRSRTKPGTCWSFFSRRIIPPTGTSGPARWMPGCRRISRISIRRIVRRGGFGRGRRLFLVERLQDGGERLGDVKGTEGRRIERPADLVFE